MNQPKRNGASAARKYLTMSEAKETKNGSAYYKAFRIVESISLAVGVLGFGLMTTVLEVYLRLLDHFHTLKQLTLVDLNSNTENLPDDQQLRPIWLFDVLKQFCLFGQRCLTFRALLSILVFTLPESSLYNSWMGFGITAGLMAIPRILFSIWIVAEDRDFLHHSQPKNPNRRVNVSIKLVGLLYNGIRKTFKVLTSIERLLILLCQYSQYVFLQLVGYSYNDHRIALYSELESFTSVLCASFINSYCSGVLPVDGFLLLTLYFSRILIQKA